MLMVFVASSKCGNAAAAAVVEHFLRSVCVCVCSSDAEMLTQTKQKYKNASKKKNLRLFYKGLT